METFDLIDCCKRLTLLFYEHINEKQHSTIEDYFDSN